jgi:Protein of Unknown function (DUF2784)
MADALRLAYLKLLDGLFHLAHVVVILFSALGWLYPPARPAHLCLQGLILFSWFGLGIKKGWTYCFLTDLHWRVKRLLRQPDPGESYVKLLADRIAGRSVDQQLLWKATVGVFFATTIISALLELRSRM